MLLNVILLKQQEHLPGNLLGISAEMTGSTEHTSEDDRSSSTTPSGQDDSSCPRSPPVLEKEEIDDMEVEEAAPPAAVAPTKSPARWTVRAVLISVH